MHKDSTNGRITPYAVFSDHHMLAYLGVRRKYSELRSGRAKYKFTCALLKRRCLHRTPTNRMRVTRVALASIRRTAVICVPKPNQAPSLPARVPVPLPTDLFAAVTLSYGVQERGLRKVRDVHGVRHSQQRLRVHVFQVCSLDPEFLMPQVRSEDARHWESKESICRGIFQTSRA